MAASLDVKATAAALKALPFIGEVDFEALMGQFKTQLKARADIDADGLHTATKALGIDKEVEEPSKEGEEGEEEAAPASEEKEGEEGEEAPPKPVKYTENAKDLFAVLAGGKASVDASALLATLQLCTGGWGEASLKNILAAFDLAGLSALSEQDLWEALTWSAPNELTSQQRLHLRKAWRTAERWAPEEKEEEGDDDEEGESKEPEQPDTTIRVITDDFVEKVREDEYLAAALLTDVPVPADPVAEEEEEED